MPEGARTQEPDSSGPGPEAPGTGSAGVPQPGPAEAAPAAIPALSVAGAARGLGVAPATLRSWERRYGLAPSLHTAGGHRRYGPADLARLQVMHRLVRDGVPPAEAARVAIRTPVPAEPAEAPLPYAALLGGSAVPPAEGVVAEGAGAGADGGPGAAGGSSNGSAGGGRVLPMPRRTRTARGLARAAMALDAHSCHRTIEASLADRGVLPTWDDLIRPVLAAIGERWEQTGSGIEVEHSFSVVAAGALSAHAARLARPRNDRPVLLASVPDELHDLPLVALQAALADLGIRSQVLGARTPPAALADAAVRLGPPVIFLWAQLGGAQLPHVPTMRPMPLMVVGGPGWGVLPEGVEHVVDLAGAVGAVRTAMGL